MTPTEVREAAELLKRRDKVGEMLEAVSDRDDAKTDITLVYPQGYSCTVLTENLEVLLEKELEGLNLRLASLNVTL